MKGKLLSKSRVIAILCCFAICLATFATGAFLLRDKPGVSADAAVVGFYNTDGASLRYDDEKAGLRYQTVVTEEQYDAWTEAYGSDATYTFHTLITKEGATAEDVGKDFVSASDIKSHDWTKGDFVFNAAIFFDLKTDGADKTDAELYEIFSTQYEAKSYVIVNGDTTVNATEANNLRSIRNIALLNRVYDTAKNTAQAALLNKFSSNLSGETLVETTIESDKSVHYYDNYRDDTCGITVEFGSVVSGYTALIGANVIDDENVQFVGSDLQVKNVKSYLTVGESHKFALDVPSANKVYVLENVIDATEIFYNENGNERLKKVFELGTVSEIFGGDNATHTETYIDDEGTEYSAKFYAVDRGYYVLGEDIDFEGDYQRDTDKLPSTMTHGMYTADGTKAGSSDWLAYDSGKAYSGLFGFGGTFDGNGHTIKNFINYWDTNYFLAQGLFGALAYGATVKNVGFVDFLRCQVENQRYALALAMFTGSTTTAKADGTADQIAVYNYINAKYGTTDCITVDNVYVSVLDKEISATDDTNIFYKSKKDGKTVYTTAYMAMVYEGNESFFTIKNSILEMPNPKAVTHNDRGGSGFIAGSVMTAGSFQNNLGAIENSYLISETVNGRVTPTFNKQVMAKGGDKPDAAVGSWNEETDTYFVNSSRSYEIYAANDFKDITDGNMAYSGYDNSGKWVVTTEKDTTNVKIYHNSGVLRFDNYADMTTNNEGKSKEGFDEAFWNFNGGRILWKGSKHDMGMSVSAVNVTNAGAQVFEVNDEIEITAEQDGKNITSSVTLATSDASIVTVDNVNKTAKVTGSGTAKITVSLGSQSKEYSVIAGKVVKTEYHLSADYLNDSGEKQAYSMIYKTSDKDLVASTWLELYQSAVANSSATVSNVYILESGVLRELDITEGQIKLNDPSAKQQVSIVVVGSEGLVGFANIQTVTMVLTKAVDYLYVNTTATTRAGYYVIGNDFDAIPDGKTVNQENNVLNDQNVTDSNRTLGFSFGSWDTTIDKPRTTIKVSDYPQEGFYGPFVGTIDGLGHTVNNVETTRVGLLGMYTDVTQTATLKNVQFTNLKTSYLAWEGETSSEGKKVINGRATRETILATFNFTNSANTYNTENVITLDNVVISMDKDKTHYREHSRYGDNLGLAENATFTGLDGATRWSFFMYCRDDGNNSYMDTKVQKIKFVDTILDYAINDGLDMYVPNYGGENVIAIKDESAGGQLDNLRNYMLAGLDGLTLIVAPTHSGRIASAFYGHVSKGTTTGSLIAISKTDFDNLFPDKAGTGVSDPVYMGYASDTDLTWKYSTDKTEIGVPITLNGREFVTFFAMPFSRYDSISTAMAAGVTKIGNFNVTADGFVWSPVAD